MPSSSSKMGLPLAQGVETLLQLDPWMTHAIMIAAALVLAVWITMELEGSHK